MGYAAIKDNAMLAVLYDGEVENPRTFSESLGTMVCWHRRYSLGDEHNYDEPYKFLESLVLESVSSEDIIKFAKESKYLNVAYNRSEKGYDIQIRCNPKQEFSDYSFVEGKYDDIQDELAEEIVEAMTRNELHTLAKQKNEILPVYLYDHSILRMSTTTFVGKAVHAEWDSGLAGFIYASHKDIEKEYGEVSTETIEKAKTVLEGEITDYDAYLSGDSYGFKLFRNGEEENSCWGFFGDIDVVKHSIAEHLPEELKDMVNDLEYMDELSLDDLQEEYSEMEVGA